MRTGTGTLARRVPSSRYRDAPTDRVRSRVAVVAGQAVLPLSVTVGVLALWEVVARARLVYPRFFPPIDKVAVALADEVQTLHFWSAIGETLRGACIGFAIAVVLGVLAGVLVGLLPAVWTVFRVVIEYLRPIPSVAVIPAAVLLFGSTPSSEVALVAYAAFWPVLYQTMYGVRSADPTAIDTARVYGLSWRRRVRWVIVPSSIPFLWTGIRLGAATALVLAVTAEFIIGIPGLGKEVANAQNGVQVPDMYAFILVTGALGISINALVQAVGRRLVRWTPNAQQVTA